MVAALYREASALRRCVYTVLTGGYEVLREQPAARESGLDFICFTDRPAASETWQIREMRKPFPADDFRSQRAYKLRPHAVLPEFDASLYIDNSVLLKLPPERLFEAVDPDAALAAPGHSFRATLRDEFTAAAEHRLDDPARIAAQLADYEVGFSDILDRPPLWNGILLRQHHDAAAIAAADIWAAHVYRYSRRDQLSVQMACHLAGLVPQILPLDNHDSLFHSWPHIASRQASARIWRGDIRVEDQLRLENARLAHELREAMAGRDALLRSRSWRLTAPLRRLVRRWNSD